jgi:mRNA interferase RelE/StbE
VYQIRLHREARKELEGLPDLDYERISAVLDLLQENPRPAGSLKLTGHDLWRVRVGRHRVIYEIVDSSETVFILRIAPRTERTYRNL